MYTDTSVVSEQAQIPNSRTLTQQSGTKWFVGKNPSAKTEKARKNLGLLAK